MGWFDERLACEALPVLPTLRARRAKTSHATGTGVGFSGGGVNIVRDRSQ